MNQPDHIPHFAIAEYARGTGPQATLARMLLFALDELEMLQITNMLVVDNSEVIYDAYRRKHRKLKRLKRRLRRV